MCIDKNLNNTQRHYTCLASMSEQSDPQIAKNEDQFSCFAFAFLFFLLIPLLLLLFLYFLIFFLLWFCSFGCGRFLYLLPYYSLFNFCFHLAKKWPIHTTRVCISSKIIHFRSLLRSSSLLLTVYYNTSF